MVRLQHSEKGFTLVELAIVMTIIGLLIGGILKGQMLMQNARVTAEVAEVKAISAAMTTFKDMYSAVPGDMPSAGTRLVGCGAAPGTNCTPSSANAGDGIVGLPTWTTAAGAAWTAPAYAAASPAGANPLVDQERYLFWQHLLLANLIGNVTNAPLFTATNWAFGVTHPDIKLGGGFQVGYDSGNPGQGDTAQTAADIAGISGTIIAQVTGAELPGGIALSGAISGNILTPQLAQQIDLKMDDGKPASGYVQAFGVQTSCMDVASAPDTAAAPGYLTSVSTTDCGLIFRIEN
jgi:prepilin-type N-terminal cleavage/methylation domain-containing protein